MTIPNALRFGGTIAPGAFVLVAPLVLLSQYLMSAALILGNGLPLVPNTGFWLLPLTRAVTIPGQRLWAATLAIVIALTTSWLLALLAFRRASHARRGHALAAFACVPAVQALALALLAVMPRSADGDAERVRRAADITLGLLAGITLTVLAVLISAVVLGAYGWGVFVATPFMVGLTTGWFANRGRDLSDRQTLALVVRAALVATLALVMFALEGIFCVLLAAPLGAGVAVVGGWLGRAAARSGRHNGTTTASVAILPALILMDAALPPAIVIPSRQSIDIAAPPAAVWRAIVDDAPITVPPGLMAAADVAYPIRSELRGAGIGAERLGYFSTGIARERVTAWAPGRTLAFAILSQPPSMHEMSPYREVHAPHVSGYFDTLDTRFDLRPLPGGGTRLTVSATHVLRMDPVLYWEPLARLAIRMNVTRVLADIDARSRRSGN